MEKILITGVSGLLGNNLARYFRNKFSVLGLYHRHPVVIPGVQTEELNLLEKPLLQNRIASFQPDVVVHCAGLTDLDFCEKNRDTTFAVNVETTRNIVSCLANRPAKLVFTSSDAVYDGEKGNYNEEDSAHPINYYGWTKLEAEKVALQRGGVLVLRTNIFGWNILSKMNLGEWIVSCLKKKERIKGFKDVHFSALYTFAFAEVLEKCLQKNLGGLYVCASCTSLSKFEFAVQLANFFKLDVSLIQPSSVDGFPFIAKRGKNYSLCTGKLAQALAEPLPSLEEGIKQFYKDFQQGLPAKIKQENVFSPD